MMFLSVYVYICNLQHAELQSGESQLTEKVMSAGSLASEGSASSHQSMQHGGAPELMLGLVYNASTGRLSVEVIKGSNFKNLATSKPPGAIIIIFFYIFF